MAFSPSPLLLPGVSSDAQPSLTPALSRGARAEEGRSGIGFKFTVWYQSGALLM